MKQSPPPLPGFVLRADREFTDERMRALSMREAGLVYWLKLACWCNGDAPSDPRAIARLIGAETSDVKRALTPTVKAMFIQCGDRLQSPELEQERLEATRRKRAFSEAGKRGAAERWRPRDDGLASDAANGHPIAGSKEGNERKELERTEQPASPQATQGHLRRIRQILDTSKMKPMP
jgi:uncharacterized protein YdaU (DUF1376 family)